MCVLPCNFPPSRISRNETDKRKQNPATTRLYFSDGSVAYLSNDTFYGSDGTFIDYKTGVYEYPNGTIVDFTPDSSAATSSAGSGSQPTATGAGTVPGATVTSAVAGTSTGSSGKNAGGKVEPGILGVLVGLVAVLF